MKIHSLTCEYMKDPLGMDAKQPRLSWMLQSDERGQNQTAYQILTADSAEALARDEGNLWDTGKVNSSQSVLVPYAGKPLKSRQRCYWKVRVWDNNARPGEWSSAASWEMGLLSESDWQPASWIRLKEDTRSSPHSKRPLQAAHMPAPADWEAFPSPLLRKEFKARQTVSRARAYICGLGYYELFVNGKKVGDQVLDPGQTTYDVHAFYVTHDLTPCLQNGDNAIGISLGNGFFGQNMAFTVSWLAWGPPAVICKLVIDYSDGTSEVITTDNAWRAETGPVVFDNVYAGETYDARLERNGWNTPGYDDSAWQQAEVVEPVSPMLKAQMIPPIKPIRTIKPQNIVKTDGGKWIFDLGQNIAGWARIKVNEPAGTQVELRSAETLTPDGKKLEPATTGVFATGVVQTDIYICKGTGAEVWEPRFTYHGFRYVEVSGLTKEPGLDMLEGVLVRSAVEPRGSFNCSSDLLNRIYRTSMWTIEDNLHSTSEDCPHREKCGWLGDAHCVAETGIFNFDMAQFWAKFMDDVETTLGRGGQTYERVPATPGIPCNIAVGKRLCEEARPDWGVAVVMLPWYLYVYYGDTRVMAEHYELMKGWISYVNNMAEGHIVYQGYGDWCPPGGNEQMECPVPLSSTAFHYGALRIMEQVASLLKKPEDASKYAVEAGLVKRSFIDKFFDTKSTSYGSQTANALALRFGLAPEGRGIDVARAMADNVIKDHQGHPFIGIHGGRPLFSLLDEYGFNTVAFDAMTIKGFPGYDFIFNSGYTTWPETLVDMPQGDPANFGSYNHPMQSGFAAWFHESIGGIKPTATSPGFKHIELKPHHFERLKFAEVEHQSMYGRIVSNWQVTNGIFEWQISIPINTTATIHIPAKDVSDITESGAPAEEAAGVRFICCAGGRAVFELGSGEYRFSSKL